MSLSYMQQVRIFHLLLALFLLYGAKEYFNKKMPQHNWWVILSVLASGAFVYHGYRLLQSLR